MMIRRLKYHLSVAGCAISISAASMLTEFAKGKTVKELKKINDSDMMQLLAIEVSESRKKCALLALSTLKDALCQNTK